MYHMIQGYGSFSNSGSSISFFRQKSSSNIHLDDNPGLWPAIGSMGCHPDGLSFPASEYSISSGLAENNERVALLVSALSASSFHSLASIIRIELSVSFPCNVLSKLCPSLEVQSISEEGYTRGSGSKSAPTYPRVLGDFCVQAIRAQFYGMIGRRRHLVVVYSPALIVDEPGSLVLGILPSGYGPVYTVGALVAAGKIDRQAGIAYL
ncbi:hypothetical protein F2Q69_00036281 [Brassica cretica]|uniref:Uncharacterized protein n=1 Tax=Brassica cretica TaxID=69181 RepID=A0A8S9SPR5_BRACR|nr:hypothetical protein F2Q69_00036281 [Brassica cretica]